MAGLKILVFNAGSSSFKASLFDLDKPAEDGAAPTGLLWERIADSADDAKEMVSSIWSGSKKILEGPEEIDVVGHRVVFGGSRHFKTVRLDDAVRRDLTRVEEYAPAHNAPAIAAMDAATRIFGTLMPQIAVFDTAFHQSMPPEAYTYAGPYVWLEKGIRRFGFHGLSHRYTSHRAARLLEKNPADLRIVTCHLGSGCSLAAVRGGRSVDTTMGFTPLDGVPMARRSGAVDPGILLHLLRHGGQTADSLDKLLNHESGLASGDIPEILAAIDERDTRAELALGVFVHRVRQGIASMAASMGGIDALVFSGGVGENSPRVRDAVCEGLAFLGVTLDSGLNSAAAGEATVAGSTSRIPVMVVPAEENWIIAQECLVI